MIDLTEQGDRKSFQSFRGLISHFCHILSDCLFFRFYFFNIMNMYRMSTQHEIQMLHYRSHLAINL